jgi:hypothetical protein
MKDAFTRRLITETTMFLLSEAACSLPDKGAQLKPSPLLMQGENSEFVV